MIVYFVVFLLSFILSLMSIYFKKNNCKKLFVFLSIISILLPCILAGFRARGIGTDTNYYIDIVFNITRHCKNVTDAISTVHNQLNIEYLYAILNFIVSRFTNNVNILYFIYEFIIILFVYLSCLENNEGEYHSSISYFIFLILFFNKSLNMCRQSIAIAIFMYSLKYALNRKFWKYLLFCVIISGFHISGILMILVYPIVNFTNSSDKILKKFLIMLFCLCILLFYQPLLLFFINYLHILDVKYLAYVNSGQSNIIIIEFLFILLNLIIILLNKNDNTKFEKYKFLFIIGTIMYCTGFYSNYAWRIGYYFTYLIIFIIPKLNLNIKFGVSSLKLVYPIVIVMLFYSYLYYDYFNYDQTVPYKIVQNN